MITVHRIENDIFEVTVSNQTTTTHRVTVPDAYYKKLTDSKVKPEILLEKSFEFLLERESNTSILRTFELSVIGHYFPEYESIIKERVHDL